MDASLLPFDVAPARPPCAVCPPPVRATAGDDVEARCPACGKVAWTVLGCAAMPAYRASPAPCF